MKRCYACFKEYEDSFSVCPYCGQVEDNRPNEPIQLAPGTVLAGRYLLGKAVGSGGFGIVYKAYDLKLETVVAVKEFFVSRLVTRAEGLKNLIVSKKSQTEYEYRKERFLAEAKTMAKFGAHRSIPNVFEFFEENNTAYIVMELLHGVALNTYLAQNGGRISVDFALLIANEVGKALRSLHEQGIVHRDVAPDNIFICSGKDIRIKLMDLGAAKLTDTTDDVIDIILKPGYSPVEQYDNSKNIGPWTDIYALGATLYAMLTGVKPDESTNRKIADTVVPPDQLNPLVSENLSNAVMKAIAVEKHMRFKTVDEFLAAINGERKVTTLVAERKRRRARRTGGVLAACLVLLSGAAYGYSVFSAKRADEVLKPADITVWYAVADGSTEKEAMEAVKADFEQKFPGVNLALRDIPEEEYRAELEKAAAKNALPTLFESSGLPDTVVNKARDLDAVLRSEQYKECLFSKAYADAYRGKKQMPLAIEVPAAYVITSGAASLSYESSYFQSLRDFGEGTVIACDAEYTELLSAGFDLTGLADRSAFLNNEANTSPVLLSSTMALNEVRETVTNYEKKCVYPNGEKICCRFIYEWSIGGGSGEELAAAEKLLSWMLGNVYQSTLMISKCSDGQLPLNPTCFSSKIQNRNLAPIGEIYEKFTFEGQD